MRRDVHGIVVLDKPVGLSSNRALQRVRQLFRARKAGHTGSLDPLASGVLPLCFGEATKVSGLLLDAAKTYEVTGRLGQRTSTGDAEGEIVEERDWRHVDAGLLESCLERFRGAIEQVPPMYSALKHKGERLYELARRGERVERAARAVTVHSLRLTDMRGRDFSLHVSCSKGTYMRTLVEDIGRELDSCAHVTQLRRTRAGPFRLEDAVSLDVLERASGEALDRYLLAPDRALESLPAVRLDARSARRLHRGQAVDSSLSGIRGRVRLYDHEDRFLGLGEADSTGRVAPKRLFPGLREAVEPE